MTTIVDGNYYANADGDNTNKYLELMNQDIDSIKFEFDAEDGSLFRIDRYELCYSFCKYYWVGDLTVYGGNPVNVRNEKKTQNISQPKILFSRTSKQLYKQ